MDLDDKYMVLTGLSKNRSNKYSYITAVRSGFVTAKMGRRSLSDCANLVEIAAQDRNILSVHKDMYEFILKSCHLRYLPASVFDKSEMLCYEVMDS